MHACASVMVPVKMYTHILSFTLEVDGTDNMVGYLDYDVERIGDDHTFILATNAIPCDGTVVAWEFCYHMSNRESVTFYPGIWRVTSHGERPGNNVNYELIQSTEVTFDQRKTSCQVFNLSHINQFIAPKNSFIGLYSDRRAQLLRTNDDNSSITTFQRRMNRSSVGKNDNHDVNFNIAIRVHLGK